MKAGKDKNWVPVGRSWDTLVPLTINAMTRTVCTAIEIIKPERVWLVGFGQVRFLLRMQGQGMSSCQGLPEPLQCCLGRWEGVLL